MQKEIIKYFASKGIKVDRITKLRKGTNKNTYKIFANKVFILKLYDKNESFLSSQIKWLREAHKYADIAIYPLNEKVLHIADKWGYYYLFFSGVEVQNAKIRNKEFWFGEKIAQFDLVLSKVKQEKRKSKFYSWDERKDIKKLIAQLKSEKSIILDLVKTGFALIEKDSKKIDFSLCRTQLVHRDLHYSNMLYNKEKIKIIDTDCIDCDLLPASISIIISYCFSKKFNPKSINDLLQGYTEKIILNKIELTVITLLIVKRKLTELAWLKGQLKSGKHTKKEFEEFSGNTIKNLKNIVQNYDLLKQFFSEKSKK